MKKLLFITCVLIVNLSFAQQDTNPQLEKLVLSTAAMNPYELQTAALDKIESLSVMKATNNSEGKFPHYNKAKTLLTHDNTSTNTQSLVKEDAIINPINNNAFVDKIVLKILQDENIRIADFQSSLDFNGDKNIGYYKNYVGDVNRLIIAHQLKENISVQIGNDIYSYVNKMFKTEIDRTLLSSLNLFAINF